jgi:hypothetical protein
MFSYLILVVSLYPMSVQTLYTGIIRFNILLGAVKPIYSVSTARYPTDGDRTGYSI